MTVLHMFSLIKHAFIIILTVWPQQCFKKKKKEDCKHLVYIMPMDICKMFIQQNFLFCVFYL